MANRLWLLELSDEEWDYDRVVALLARASSEDDARRSAASAMTDERDAAAYTDPGKSTCVEVPVEGDAEVLLAHLRHG
jgi:hypothetical protein